jgi:hypothetical protein
MTVTGDRLEKAIDSLYKAFSDQPAPSVIEGCPHCFDYGELETLLTKPLRELTPDELSSYTASAFLTAGDVPDYLYLLPRIIDVSIRDDYYGPDLEITGRAIKESGFAYWTYARQQALLAVFYAYLDDLIAAKKYFEMDGLMCILGRIDVPLDRFLDRIAATPDAVIGYWEVNAGTLEKGKLTNAFWEPSDRQDEIVRWFNRHDIALIYASAYGRKLGT